MGSRWGEPVPKWKLSMCWIRIRGALCQEGSFSGHFSIKKCYFPVKQKSQNWLEIKFQRNIWGQLDVRTRMRASKSWNFDLEKPIKPIKMDSCVIFADHCSWSSRFENFKYQPKDCEAPRPRLGGFSNLLDAFETFRFRASEKISHEISTLLATL